MTMDIDQLRETGALGPARSGGSTSPSAAGSWCSGDLLLPPDPSPSSLATCRDIAQKLAEWQGPGVVVICGQLVAGRLPRAGPAPAEALRGPLGAHGRLRRLRRPPRLPGRRGRRPTRPGADERRPALAGLGVSLEAAGRPALRDRRRGAARPGPRRHPPSRHQPAHRRHARETIVRGWPGWSASTIPAWPGASSPRACSTGACAATCGRPRSILAALALLLRLEFVIDGLGHVFRSPRQQRALQHAYDASWFSRLLVTIVIGVALLAVLAVVVAVTSRGIWRALGGEGLPSPWSSGGVAGRRAPGRRRTRCSPSTGRTSSTSPGRPSVAAPPA